MEVRRLGVRSGIFNPCGRPVCHEIAQGVPQDRGDKQQLAWEKQLLWASHSNRYHTTVSEASLQVFPPVVGICLVHRARGSEESDPAPKPLPHSLLSLWHTLTSQRISESKGQWIPLLYFELSLATLMDLLDVPVTCMFFAFISPYPRQLLRQPQIWALDVCISGADSSSLCNARLLGGRVRIQPKCWILVPAHWHQICQPATHPPHLDTPRMPSLCPSQTLVPTVCHWHRPNPSLWSSGTTRLIHVHVLASSPPESHLWRLILWQLSHLMAHFWWLEIIPGTYANLGVGVRIVLPFC